MIRIVKEDPLLIVKRYILVCIGYVTKWVEPNSLPRENEKSVVYFLFECILFRFCVPKEIRKSSRCIRLSTRIILDIIPRIMGRWSLQTRLWRKF